MPGTDALDDAPADHERFEAELVAQDQDAARVAVADIDERRAHSLVNDLVDDGESRRVVSVVCVGCRLGL